MNGLIWYLMKFRMMKEAVRHRNGDQHSDLLVGW